MAQIVKRVIDPDTRQEVSLSKKPRYALEVGTKVKVLRFFGLAYNAAWMHSVPAGIPLGNISVGVQVMNSVITAHTILRQKSSNPNAPLAAKVFGSTQSWTHQGTQTEIDMKGIVELVQFCANLSGLSYTDAVSITYGGQQAGSSAMQVDEDGGLIFPAMTCSNLTKGKDWFGIAGPFSNFLSGFGLRMKELRLGHSEFPVSKDANSTTSYPISKFGLNRAHHILLEGIRFPPEKRSSMVQSLGPMTTVLCYIQSNALYETKFLNAAVSSLFHIPNIEAILKTVKTLSRSNAQAILGLIGDITLISTSRQRHRATPPPGVFAYYVTNPTHVEVVRTMLLKSNIQPATTTVATQTLEEYLTMSGFPAAYLYNVASSMSFSLNGTFTPAEAAQVIFHCWWGSYKEDFGILKSITGVNEWFKRDQLGNKFQKMNTSAAVTNNITLCKLTKFAKLASANQVGAMAQGQKQVMSMPVFGGRRKRKFDQGFFKYLDEQTPAGSGVLTPTGIEADLTALLRNLKTRLQNSGGSQDAGTTRWINMERSNTFDHLKKPETLVYFEDNLQLVETCEYFLN